MFFFDHPNLMMQYGVRAVLQNNLGMRSNIDLEIFNFYIKWLIAHPSLFSFKPGTIDITPVDFYVDVIYNN